MAKINAYENSYLEEVASAIIKVEVKNELGEITASQLSKALSKIHVMVLISQGVLTRSYSDETLSSTFAKTRNEFYSIFE